MDARALARAVEEDRRDGILPFCVVATVGTTSTSSIDPVPEIADVCEREKLWLHVDAAYAGSAAIVPELRHLFAGCERADSLVTNPHKWLFTPFDLSVLYTRRMDVLHRAFSLVPEYLRTLEAGKEAVRNHSDYGVQLGRRFRALKLWMVIRYFGREGLAARIREHCRLARLFAAWVEAAPGWELLAPVPLGLVCFRAAPAARRRNRRRARRTARRAQRSNHERRQRDRRGVPLAHETQRQLHAPPRHRQHPHDRSARRQRLATPAITLRSPHELKIISHPPRLCTFAPLREESS